MPSLTPPTLPQGGPRGLVRRRVAVRRQLSRCTNGRSQRRGGGPCSCSQFHSTGRRAFAPCMPDWERRPLNLCCSSTNAMARLNISALSCGKSMLCLHSTQTRGLAREMRNSVSYCWEPHAGQRTGSLKTAPVSTMGKFTEGSRTQTTARSRLSGSPSKEAKEGLSHFVDPVQPLIRHGKA
jgi:hypothetical protein